ncbi:hypothetical protein [Natronoglycomyces albus]|uniref:Lipoprotein n=1 Tax=Natronoglycomyces albus TaxID=2811108 RepID=A0A895XGU9_9ACTN|nr:hypothetical protein [Natronoglycomyces albus]QSB04574.1 hypothetical protein JQS30_12440 [Natronoglycomyces albus]
MSAFPRAGRLVSIVALAAVATLSACSDPNGNGGGDPRQDYQVLDELSKRATSGIDHSYTADYMVGSGSDQLRLVRDAEGDRMAIGLMDELHVFTPAYTAYCQAGECTREDEHGLDLAEWMRDLTPQLLPAQWDASYWLSALDADSSADIDYHDTRLAGELADCIEVAGAVESPVSAFELCLTTHGVIASLTAVVDGEELRVKLTSIANSVDEEYFTQVK